jgi:hypothetical protein
MNSIATILVMITDEEEPASCGDIQRLNRTLRLLERNTSIIAKEVEQLEAVIQRLITIVDTMMHNESE